MVLFTMTSGDATFLGATLPNWEEWSRVIYYNTGIEMTPMAYNSS